MMFRKVRRRIGRTSCGRSAANSGTEMEKNNSDTVQSNAKGSGDVDVRSINKIFISLT